LEFESGRGGGLQILSSQHTSEGDSKTHTSEVLGFPPFFRKVDGFFRRKNKRFHEAVRLHKNILIIKND
jgi:hypothetical protein